MARILIAWELGEALGHLARALHLTLRLRERGHEVVLVLKRLPEPGDLAGLPGVLCLPAPPLRQSGPPDGIAPVNYADLLRCCGYADAAELAARLTCWRGLLARTCPDVLLADHAPTALLAARMEGVAHLAVGNGFAVPPRVDPWPSIRPWQAVDVGRLNGAERALDDVVDAALARQGFAARVRMRELYGAQDVLDTFPELDHYGARPEGCYVGPIMRVTEFRSVSWQPEDGHRVLAYLRTPMPGFGSLVKGLADSGAEVLCVVPGLPADAARGLATRRMRIACVPVALPALLREASLAVGYGSSGFATEALLAGVPVLSRPRHVEQALFARRIAALGAGRLLEGRLALGGVAEVVRDLLARPDSGAAARAFAERHHDYCPDGAVDRTVAAIERCVGVVPTPASQPNLVPESSMP